MQKWKNWMNRFRIFYSALKKKRKYILYVFYARITVLGAEIVVFLFRRR